MEPKKESYTVTETKSEIKARIDELQKLQLFLGTTREKNWEQELPYYFEERTKQLEERLDEVPNNIFEAVLESHTVLCRVKNMEPKAAYGQNPGLYYAAGVAGEAGEMCNKIVKALRNGYNYEAMKEAVESELPDVFIYGAIEAFIFDIDIYQLVSDKAEVVAKRAIDGYYGIEFK